MILGLKIVSGFLASTITFTSIMCTYSNTTPLAEPVLQTQNIKEFTKGMKRPGEADSKSGDDNNDVLQGGNYGALNLALLSDPKVHQYVKDYFTICEDAHKGNIFDFKVLPDASTYFGINLAEQGHYDNSCFPKSYIPFRKVLSGYGGDVTLYNYNSNVKNSVGVEPRCDEGAYYTCFQLDAGHAGVSNNKACYIQPLKGKYKGGAGKNVTSTHICDRFYFPDQLHQVAKRVNSFLKNHKDENAKVFNPNFVPVLADFCHARGEGGIDAFCGVPLGGSGNSAHGQFDRYCINDEAHQKEFLRLVNDYFTFMMDTKVDFKEIKDFTFDAPMVRFVGIFKLVKDGWKLWHTTGSEIYRQLNRYDSKYVCGIFKAITGETKSKAEIIAWVKASQISSVPSRFNLSDYGLNSGLSNLYPNGYNAMHNWGAFIDVNCKLTSNLYKAGTKPVFRYADGLNFGHQVMTGVVGKFQYGKLLASMKLPVDPTNPSTYLIGGNGGGKSTGNTGVTPTPEIKKSDYIPTGTLTKPTCAVRNVIPSRSGVELKQKGLCAYFTKGGKPNSNSIVGAPEWFSPINSVGEKDGMPVFTQGRYYTNGVHDFKGYNLPHQGCPIFAFCSLMYGVGMGTDKSPHLTPQLKKVLASPDCPTINGTKYLTPMALAKGLDWLHGGSPWTAYGNMFKVKLGIDVVSKTWNPSHKAKDLEAFEKELSQGYGFVLSVTSKKMKWYRPKDLAKNEVEYVCDSVVTGNNHFVTVYTLNNYKDVKTGRTFKGVQVIDGANLCAHSKGRFVAGECDNDYILDLDSLYNAKNFCSAFHRFTFPNSVTAGTATQSVENTQTEEQGTGGHFVILDDTVRPLTTMLDALYCVTPISETRGYINWHYKELSNFYIYADDIKLSNEGQVLVCKSHEGIYYRLTTSSATFRNIKAKSYNSFDKILSNQDDIMVEKFEDKNCTKPIPLIEKVD